MTVSDKNKIIGVVGAGTMGAGIAQVAAANGHKVRLYDQMQHAATKALVSIEKGLQKLLQRGRMTESDLSKLLSNITPAQDLTEFSDCDLVIEAVIEDLQIKQELFISLESICAESTLLASNTSSISITAIAAKLKRPENFAGLHFFNPAPIMKLVEVVSGLATADKTISALEETARDWGKITVKAKSTPGFIVNRVARPFYAEALRLREENAAETASLDAIVRESGGFRMGPFELMDLIGLDVNYMVTESVFNAYYQDPKYLPSLLQKEMVAGGFLGRKSGRGFYHYESGSEREAVEYYKSDFIPEHVEIKGTGPIFTEMIEKVSATGISHEVTNGAGILSFGEVNLALTDGRTATRRSRQDNVDNLVLFDLQLDLKGESTVAIAAAMQADPVALDQVAGFFNHLGKKVIVINDAPGLCLMRTVCMLANEGADAVYQGVCDAESVDKALLYALNYPRGPLAWAQAIGLDYVCQVLQNLQACYGFDRYRASPLIQQLADAGENFYAN